MRHEVVDQAKSELIVLPHVDPTRGRRRLDVAYGMTLAEMAVVALPGVPLDHVRVSIGEHVIDRKIWHRVRPHHGATVIIRAVPGDDTLRSVLSVAVIVAAVALGQFYAPALAGSVAGSIFPAGVLGLGGAVTGGAALTSVVGSLLTAGFAIAGSLLLNALIPVRGLGDQDKGTDIYAITGLKNSANPGDVIPSVLGKHRYAPPYAATPFTEIIGDDQFVTAAFLVGHGPVDLTNHRLGNTPVGSFSDVQIEVRQGYAGESPLTLYPQQVIEEQLSAELNSQAPVLRLTARDATECSVDIAFVQGLLKYTDKGKKSWRTVSFAISYRKLGSAAAPTVINLEVISNRQAIVRRTVRWALPERGQYEVSIMRVTPDSEDARVIDKAAWSAIRSFRPESPFNFHKPVAMVAIRIRASGQLNGVVDNYNADVAILCPDWDAGSQSWVTRATQNPASLFRHVLQGAANAYPKTDDELDLVKLQQWHEFCTAKGLKYNRVHDYNATRLDVLADIAAAGRATPHDDGERWGVVVDTAQSIHVSAITSRNSWDFQGTTPQVLFPDGHRVQFIDETNGYNQAERIIPFPGVSTDKVEVTEDLPMPGITDPALVWKEARRRQYELIYRPHTYTVSQDIEGLVLARGDLTHLNHDVLDRNQGSARIRSVNGQILAIDTPMTMEAGRAYSIVIRKADGSSIQRTVITVDGETNSLMVVGDLTDVAPGNLAMVGRSTPGPTLDVVVKSVERGDNMTAKLTLVDAAPEIEALVDAETPPAWDGRVGDLTDQSALVPSVPVMSISDSALTIQVALKPGGYGGILPATYVVSHRLHGGGAFSSLVVQAATSAAFIGGYIVGDVVDIKARSVSLYGTSSADSAVQQWTLNKAEKQNPTADSDAVKADSATYTADFF